MVVDGGGGVETTCEANYSTKAIVSCSEIAGVKRRARFFFRSGLPSHPPDFVTGTTLLQVA